MPKAVETADKVITKINEVILVTVLASVFILVFSNVVGRYVFSRTHIWVDELARHLMISIAFFGMGLAMRYGNHTSFNILQGILPDRVRKFLRIAVLIIAIGFMVIFLYLGLQYSIQNWDNRTETLRWRNGMWYLMIPTGSFLFIWHTLMISKKYINQSRQADIESEVAAAVEMAGRSEFLKENDSKTMENPTVIAGKAGEEKN